MLLAIALWMVLTGCVHRTAQHRTSDEAEWPAYARDPGGMRHSPLTQIDRGNVSALRWRWNPVVRQPGQPGYETCADGLLHRTGAANVWPPISVDPTRDLVFLATTAPSPDYYGGNRRGQNLFANCVVALRASTGALVWAFQTSHHDLWDYDVPMQPLLFPLERDEQIVPAVAVGTKQEHLFVLHRETDEPLFPVEERPVPQSTVPGGRDLAAPAFPHGPYRSSGYAA